MKPVTLVLESTEALLLAVALREYFQGSRDGSQLRHHATSKAVLEGILARLDPPEVKS